MLGFVVRLVNEALEFPEKVMDVFFSGPCLAGHRSAGAGRLESLGVFAPVELELPDDAKLLGRHIAKMVSVVVDIGGFNTHWRGSFHFWRLGCAPQPLWRFAW